MATPALVPGYLSVQPQRTPKLAYRTNSDDASSFTSRFSTLSASPIPTQPGPAPRYSYIQTQSQGEGRQGHWSMPSTSPDANANASKREASFLSRSLSKVFGAREPSAQALKKYGEDLKKHHHTDDKGNLIPSGLAVSSNKLPGHVPKTDSYWDGLPAEKGKGKETEKVLGSGGPLSFRTESSTSVPAYEGEPHYSAPASTSSRPESKSTSGATSALTPGSRNRMADEYGWEVTASSHGTIASGKASKGTAASGPVIRHFAAEHNEPNSSRSEYRDAAPTLPRNATKFPCDVPDTPKIPTAYLTESTIRPVRGGPSTFPNFSISPNLTRDESTPGTPNSPEPFASLTSDGQVFGNSKTTIANDPPLVKDVVVKSEGFGILAPPFTVTRRPNNSGPSLDAERSTAFGTDSAPGLSHVTDKSSIYNPSHSLETPSRSSRRRSTGSDQNDSTQKTAAKIIKSPSRWPLCRKSSSVGSSDETAKRTPPLHQRRGGSGSAGETSATSFGTSPPFTIAGGSISAVDTISTTIKATSRLSYGNSGLVDDTKAPLMEAASHLSLRGSIGSAGDTDTTNLNILPRTPLRGSASSAGITDSTSVRTPPDAPSRGSVGSAGNADPTSMETPTRSSHSSLRGSAGSVSNTDATSMHPLPRTPPTPGSVGSAGSAGSRRLGRPNSSCMRLDLGINLTQHTLAPWEEPTRKRFTLFRK